MKTHYEILGLESSADADAIKKAFRREIARYHPDKVIHLGAEFQEMAATRAAELTVAGDTSPLKLKGCGLAVINPPWQFDREAAATLAFLATALARGPGGGAHTEWVVPER